MVALVVSKGFISFMQGSLAARNAEATEVAGATGTERPQKTQRLQGPHYMGGRSKKIPAGGVSIF